MGSMFDGCVESRKDAATTRTVTVAMEATAVAARAEIRPVAI